MTSPSIAIIMPQVRPVLFTEYMLLYNALNFTYSLDSPPRRTSALVWIMTIIYTVLFLIGTMGNVWIISLLIRTACYRRKRPKTDPHVRRRNMKYGSSTQVQMLILSLSIVDTLVLATVPAIALNMWQETWRGGTVVCKMFWVCENLNKVLSTFMLLDLGMYCYLSVCRLSLAKIWNKYNGSALVITLNIIIGICMFIPIMEYSDVYIIISSNDSRPLSGPRCLFEAPESLWTMFTFYVFSLCFCAPAIIQAYCYGSVLYYVRRHIKQMTGGRSNIPFAKVSRTASILVAFYMICWCPYWCLLLKQYFTPGKDNNETSFYVGIVFHALPYVNAAVNPTLYTFLNQSIRQEAMESSRARSFARNTASMIRPSLSHAQSTNGVIGAPSRLSISKSLLFKKRCQSSSSIQTKMHAHSVEERSLSQASFYRRIKGMRHSSPLHLHMELQSRYSDASGHRCDSFSTTATLLTRMGSDPRATPPQPLRIKPPTAQDESDVDVFGSNSNTPPWIKTNNHQSHYPESFNHPALICMDIIHERVKPGQEDLYPNDYCDEKRNQSISLIDGSSESGVAPAAVNDAESETVEHELMC